MKTIIVKFYVLIIPLFLSQMLYANNSLNENEAKSISDLVDIVGQQRLFVNHALVSYIQIAQMQSYGNPFTTLKTSIIDFNTNLTLLKKAEDIEYGLIQMETVWNKFKSIVLLQPDKEKMGELIAYNEEIVKLSNTIINSLRTSSKKNSVNISGKQRMLSQRIALFMLMENWGVEYDYEQVMQTNLAEFSLNLNYLKKNKNNTAKIDKLLQSLEKDYLSLVRITAEENRNRDFSYSISRHTSQMLRKSKKTTKLYIAISHKGAAQKTVSRTTEELVKN